MKLKGCCASFLLGSLLIRNPSFSHCFFLFIVWLPVSRLCLEFSIEFMSAIYSQAFLILIFICHSLVYFSFQLGYPMYLLSTSLSFIHFRFKLSFLYSISNVTEHSRKKERHSAGLKFGLCIGQFNPGLSFQCATHKPR